MNNTPVPFLALKAQYAALRDDIDAAVHRVLASGWFILGPELSALEAEVGELLAVAPERVVGCSNGSDALVLGLRAAGLQPGDEVVTTPFTFVATGTSILRAGGRLRFADVDPVTLLLDPDAARATGARFVVPVHLFGRTCDLAPYRDSGLVVVEDAAQAIGARLPGGGAAGTGGYGCFSLYPTKNLGAAGDAGLVVATDAEGAARVRRLRTHGQARKYFADELGYNMRMDELQAAIVRVKLRQLPAWNERRRQIAARYDSLLAERVGDPVRPLPQPPVGAEHVWHAYVVRTPRRDALRACLQEAGIANQVFYPHPLHRMPAFAEAGEELSLPHAEAACSEVLALPIFPEMTEAQQETVVGVIAGFFAS